MAGRRVHRGTDGDARLMERRRFLLDTGVLLGILKDAPWARRTRSDNHLDDSQTLITTSVVCHGEIMAISEKRQWGDKKHANLTQLLSEIPAVGIKQRPILNPSPPKPARKMNQNDMWIAATAHAIEAVLVSTDRDFEHLRDAWIDFVYVDQQEIASSDVT